MSATDTAAERRIWVLKSHDAPWHEWLTGFVRPGMQVVEIGANNGEDTVILANLVGPRGRVVAFEPDPENLQRLRTRITTAGLQDRVCSLEVAVADVAGPATLYRSEHATQHALVEDNLCDSDRCGTVPIAQVTLDGMLEHLELAGPVGFVKCDAQGYEGKVLRGATRLLAQGPVWLLEIWPYGLAHAGSSAREVWTTMRDAGYVACGMDKLTRQPQPCAEDVFFGIVAERELGLRRHFDAVFLPEC